MPYQIEVGNEGVVLRPKMEFLQIHGLLSCSVKIVEGFTISYSRSQDDAQDLG